MSVSKRVKGGRTDTITPIGSRGSIQEYRINLNADCNGRNDVSGGINIKYDPEQDRIIVRITAPEYDVVVTDAKRKLKYNASKH